MTSRGGQATSRSALPKTLLITVIPDHKKDAVIEAILSSTRSGAIGDGKIFISAMDDVIRVWTGERGEEAI